MFDVWTEKIELVQKIYKKENYQVKYNRGCQNNVCCIFFSSNNIWYPNTEQAFRKSFVENDYYEWMNYSDIFAEKIIYVRDIFKSWYVTGISEELNSIDALIEFLREQTTGMRVFTVGSSAGGYMASVVAALLNAEYSICFSAQFDLAVDGALETNPFIKKYSQDGSRNQYYNTTDLLRKSKTDIFYLTPAFSEDDNEQMNRVADIRNVHILKIASKRHGVPLLRGNLLKLLQMDKDSLIDLFDSKKDQIVGILPISMKLSGFWGTCCCIKNEFVRIISRYIRR